MMVVSESGEVTLWPSTAVMTSPPERPAEAAGVLHITPSISAPEFTGAMFDGTPVDWLPVMQLWLLPSPPPLCCCCCCAWLCGLVIELAVPGGTATPRNPAVPMWIFELDCPAAI